MLGEERTSLILVTCEIYIPRAAVAPLGCSGKWGQGQGQGKRQRQRQGPTGHSFLLDP